MKKLTITVKFFPMLVCLLIGTTQAQQPKKEQPYLKIGIGGVMQTIPKLTNFHKLKVSEKIGVGFELQGEIGFKRWGITLGNKYVNYKSTRDSLNYSISNLNASILFNYKIYKNRPSSETVGFGISIDDFSINITNTNIQKRQWASGAFKQSNSDIFKVKSNIGIPVFIKFPVSKDNRLMMQFMYTKGLNFKKLTPYNQSIRPDYFTYSVLYQIVNLSKKK